MVDFEKLTGLQKEMSNLTKLTEEKLTPLIKQLSEFTGQNYDISKYVENFRQALDENRKIVLSVIGQVKYGKSTLLNALLFDGKEILPTAPNPESARLARIVSTTDEESDRATVYFYTKEEWSEIQKNNDRANNEIVASAKTKFSDSEIAELLDTERDVELHNIRDYMTTEGQYTDLVKYVDLRLANIDNYFDLEIVDTPGMNDPVVSREKITREFLKDTDAVLFLSPPDHFLDSVDLDLLLNYLPSIGLKEGIIIVPRFDELYPKQRMEFYTELKPNVTKRGRTYANEARAGINAEEMINQFLIPDNVTIVSAKSYQIGMAIKNNNAHLLTQDDKEILIEIWKNTKWPGNDIDPSEYELSGKRMLISDSLIENSGIKKLEKMIDEKITKRKAEIKLSRPFNRLNGEFSEILSKNQRMLEQVRNDLKELETDVEKLKTDRESCKRELNEFQTEIIGYMDRFKSKYDRSPFDVPILEINLEDIRNRRFNKEALQAEIELNAEKSFNNAVTEKTQFLIKCAEELENELRDIANNNSKCIDIHREVLELYASLRQEMIDTLSSSNFNIDIDIRLNIWQWVVNIFQGNPPVAVVMNALAEVTPKINRELRHEYAKADRRLRSLIDSTVSRINKKLEEERSEMENKINELNSILDNKAQEIPLKKAEWEKIENIHLMLKRELDSLKPSYDRISNKLHSYKGGEN